MDTISSASLARLGWPAAFVVVSAIGAYTFTHSRISEAPAHDVRIENAGPTVVSNIRAIARLETATLVVEKVIDVKDHQTRLRGLVDADDSLLFVARGEVVLGVDLSKMTEADTRFNEHTKTAYVKLPEPEVFSAHFDEPRSYVHSRATDVLAHRNENLEATARREATVAFAAAGRSPEAIERARASAEKQVRQLAQAWGAREVIVSWERLSEVAQSGEPVSTL